MYGYPLPSPLYFFIADKAGFGLDGHIYTGFAMEGHITSIARNTWFVMEGHISIQLKGLHMVS